MWKTRVVLHLKPLLRRKGGNFTHLPGRSTIGSVTFQTSLQTSLKLYLWGPDYSGARALSQLICSFPLFMVHCKTQMSYNKDHNLWKAPILSLVAEKADSLIISLKITIYAGMWDKSHSFLMAGRPALVQVNLLLPVPFQKPTSQLQLPQAILPGFTLTFEWPCLYYKFRGGSMTEIPTPSVF